MRGEDNTSATVHGRKQSGRVSAAWLMIGSALCFSLMAVCVRQAAFTLPVSEVVFARAIVTALISSWMVWRGQVAIPRAALRPLIMRGLWGTLGLSAYYGALALLPLAVATTLHMTAPLATAVIAAVWLRERMALSAWVALALGFFGVVIVAGPWRDAGTSWPLLGVCLAVSSAVFSGLAYATIRSVAGHMDPRLLVLALPMVTLPFAAVWMANGVRWPHGSEWGWLFAVGVTTQAGQLMVTNGLMRMPAGPATALSYVQVIFAFIWGMVWFGEVPPNTSLVGAAIVVVAILMLTLSRNRSDNRSITSG